MLWCEWGGDNGGEGLSGQGGISGVRGGLLILILPARGRVRLRFRVRVRGAAGANHSSAARSASTMIFTKSLKRVVGSQPSLALALAGVPIKRSTSEGRS